MKRLPVLLAVALAPVVLAPVASLGDGRTVVIVPDGSGAVAIEPPPVVLRAPRGYAYPPAAAYPAPYPPGTGYPDPYAYPPPYPPQAYGPPPVPPAPSAPPRCPDAGSFAVVEPAQPRGAAKGPIIAQSWNDCADLPGNGAPQPQIGVDIQIGPGQSSDGGATGTTGRIRLR